MQNAHLHRAARRDDEATATREPVRHDRVAVSEEQLRKAHETAEGFLVLDAFAAKPGVYEYSDGKGGIIRELVDAETLHRVEDLGTLGRKPVTLQHPRGPVTPKTVQAHMVGSVGERINVTADGYVQVTLTVHREDAIAAVKGGVRELSCGYYPIIDRTPGVWTDAAGVSHRYDQRQTARLYEHLALVPAGRHGSTVRARLDGTGTDDPSGETAMKIKRKIRIDAQSTTEIEAEQDIVDAVAALEANRDAESKRADAAEAEAAALKGKIAATEAELAKVKADAAEAAKANSPEELQRRADERASLVAVAVKAGIAADEARKLDGAELRKRVVAARYPTLKLDGMPEAGIDAAFQVAVTQLDAQGPLAAMAGTVAQPKTDAAPVPQKSYAETLGFVAPK